MQPTDEFIPENTYESLDKGIVTLYGLKHKIGSHNFVYYQFPIDGQWIKSTKSPKEVTIAISLARAQLDELEKERKEREKEEREALRKEIMAELAEETGEGLCTPNKY